MSASHNNDVLEWMKARNMLRKPCEPLLRPANARVADGALHYAEGVALDAGERATLDLLLDMRPHATNMMRAVCPMPHVVSPNQMAVVPSAEMARNELALMSAHLQLMMVHETGNAHILFCVYRAELPDWAAFRYSDLFKWEQLIRIMDARLARYIGLRDDYARAMAEWPVPVVGRKRARAEEDETIE